MNTGPFPVDKRSVEALAQAENGTPVGLSDPRPEPQPAITAVARAGRVTARRVPPRSAAGRRGLNVLPQSSGEAADEDGLNPPERNYDCSNYETCLGLAAALDWKSFTCGGCCGEVNQQLLWRAHHRIRNNPSLSKLCNLPVLTTS